MTFTDFEDVDMTINTNSGKLTFYYCYEGEGEYHQLHGDLQDYEDWLFSNHAYFVQSICYFSFVEKHVNWERYLKNPYRKEFENEYFEELKDKKR